MNALTKLILLVLLLPQISAPAQTTKSNGSGHPAAEFIAGSAVFTSDGSLPKLYTCDSTGISPTLNWSGAPKATVAYAVTMHHIARDRDKHVYMVLYDLPASATAIPDAVSNMGKWGINTVNRQNNYAPPCSKG